MLNIFSANIVHIHLSAHFLQSVNKFLFTLLSCLISHCFHFHAFSSEANIDFKYKSLYLKTFNAADKIISYQIVSKNGLINDLELQKKIEVLYNPDNCKNGSRLG